MKTLYWEEDSFVLLYKRLENGKFKSCHGQNNLSKNLYKKA